MHAELRQRLLQRLDEAERHAVLSGPGVDQRLADCVEQARAHGLVVEPEPLAQAIAQGIAGGVSLGELAIGDLYLASRCAHGDDAALRCFEQVYGVQLDRAIAKSPTLGLSTSEFRQLVFDRLFVHEPGVPPRISKYIGRGALKGWVRVMASRFIIDLSRRSDRRMAPDDGLAEKIGAAEDTELDYLRHAYGPALDTAFAQAVASLSVRERNLLRQRYLHEVSADALAQIYGVHRSTVFTWLDKARATLLGNVRQGLAQRLPGDQLESVVGMLGSKLQLSVRRLLDSRLETESGGER